MNIIITGGCGFIGSNLCFFLKKKIKNAKIVSVDNFSKSYSYYNSKRLLKSGIKNYKVDISSTKSLSKISFKADLIIDCSAEPAVETSRLNTNMVLNSNLVGTINILEKCKIDKSKIIFLSSSRIYPVRESYKKFKEFKNKKKISLYDEDTSILGPKTIYGYTKLASEMLVEEYSYCYNIDYIINRFGLVTGEGQFGKVEQGLISLWLWRHYHKIPLEYKGYGGKGEQIRDVLFVDDLNNLILKQIISFNKIKNQIFCAGGGTKNIISLANLTKMCENITGNKITIISNKDTSIYDIPYYVSSLKKINKFYKWKPKQKMNKGLIKIFNWMKKNNNQIKFFF